MSNLFVEPLTVQEQPFLRYVQLLDAGLVSGAVTLTADEPYGIWELRIVAPEMLQEPGDHLSELDDFAESLSQLVLFACGDAPDDVITNWADKAGAKPDVAIRRVNLIRDNMPNLAALWTAKTHARFPIVTGVRADVLLLGPGSHHGLVKLAVNENTHGVFATESQETVTFEVWPDDIDRLITDLTELRDSITKARNGDSGAKE